MRSARFQLPAALLAATAIASACAGSAEQRARDGAVAAARTEIAEGRACIWEIGRLPPNAPPDAETGLPRTSFTCEVNDASFAAQEAHNDEVRKAWSEGRIGSRRR